MADETDNENAQDAEVEAQAGDERQPEQAVAGDPVAATAKAAAESEPSEQLSSKERRRRARSTHSGEASASRTPRSATPSVSPSVASRP